MYENELNLVIVLETRDFSGFLVVRDSPKMLKRYVSVISVRFFICL